MRPGTEDVATLLNRLAVVYAHRMSDKELAEMVVIWQDVLTGVPWPEVEMAADRFLKEQGRYMPKPGEVRARALELARQRFAPTANRENVVWHTEHWSEGRDPDSGRPGLCLCGNREWFTRTEGGVWHGYVTHRDRCTTRSKAAA